MREVLLTFGLGATHMSLFTLVGCKGAFDDREPCDDVDCSGHVVCIGTGISGSMNCDGVYGTECNLDTGECYACWPGAWYCIEDDVVALCNDEGTGPTDSMENCADQGTTCNPYTGYCWD